MGGSTVWTEPRENLEIRQKYELICKPKLRLKQMNVVEDWETIISFQTCHQQYRTLLSQNQILWGIENYTRRLDKTSVNRFMTLKAKQTSQSRCKCENWRICNRNQIYLLLTSYYHLKWQPPLNLRSSGQKQLFFPRHNLVQELAFQYLPGRD